MNLFTILFFILFTLAVLGKTSWWMVAAAVSAHFMVALMLHASEQG